MMQRCKTTRAFTTVELLISTAILIVTMVALIEIIDISSDTAGVTASHAKILESSSAFRETVNDQLRMIEPGLLIIDCPAPTPARREVTGANAILRLRHDRLVFIASGAPEEFQSITFPTGATLADPILNQPASSPEALVYFGPGIPLADAANNNLPRQLATSDSLSVSLTAAEWVFLHRSILLLVDDPGVADGWWDPPDMSVLNGAGGLLNGGDLGDVPPIFDALNCEMDAIHSTAGGLRANASTLVDLIQAKNASTDLLTATPSIAALWEPSWAPTTTTADPTKAATAPDYYTRSGFNFIPGLADFRIEWTDGRRVDPANRDYRTRWFGLFPDAAHVGDPEDLPYIASRRQNVPANADTTAEERLVFQNEIEWSNPSSGGVDTSAAYRAIWRRDTWQYRPKALRFTYRLYDARNRIKHVTQSDLNEDGLSDIGGPSDPENAVRFGKEFSVIVPIP